jgi:hypothetical protein
MHINHWEIKTQPASALLFKKSFSLVTLLTKERERNTSLTL